MATYLDIGLSWAQNAGADLSAKLYYCAKVDTDGDIVLAGSGEKVFGIIAETAIENRPVTVQFGGVCKVIAGATVAAGARVMSDGNGKAITATATNHSFGIALNGADADEIFSVAMIPSVG